MRILLVGAGGVGNAIAKIAARRSFYELIVVSDYDLARAQSAVSWIAARHGVAVSSRFVAARIDASDPDDVAALAREHGATHVMNAVEPKFVPTIFAGALAAGADYLDMAMSLSRPHPSRPYEECGVTSNSASCFGMAHRSRPPSRDAGELTQMWVIDTRGRQPSRTRTVAMISSYVSGLGSS